MNKKLLTSVLALGILLLSLRINSCTALESPYVAVAPSASEPIMIDWYYTVSIYTDYDANPDVW